MDYSRPLVIVLARHVFPNNQQCWGKVCHLYSVVSKFSWVSIVVDTNVVDNNEIL